MLDLILNLPVRQPRGHQPRLRHFGKRFDATIGKGIVETPRLLVALVLLLAYNLLV